MIEKLLKLIGNVIVRLPIERWHQIPIVQWGKLTKTSWDTFSGNFPLLSIFVMLLIGVANDIGYNWL